ncbi:MAG: hypothetical protein IPO30_01280 [Hyphomonadaceae bacterium]|nr:hypothetical protein [Hyphomonadaceae bacterium]
MRPIFLAIAVAAVGLSACGEPTPSSPPAPPPPEYASNWFVAVSSKPGGALNIHETKLGFGGFMREPDGAFQPIRNIVLTDAAMSFIAPRSTPHSPQRKPPTAHGLGNGRRTGQRQTSSSSLPARWK